MDAWYEESSATRNGRAGRRYYPERAATPDGPKETIGSLKPFCGWPEPGRHGVTCQTSSGCGTRCSSASDAEHRRTFSSVFSRFCRPMPTSGPCSLTVRSYGSINTAPGQKGEPKPGYRSLARRSKYEAQREGRRAWQSGGLCLWRVSALIGRRSLLDGVEFEALIADRTYDRNALRDELPERGVTAVISPGRIISERLPSTWRCTSGVMWLEHFFCHLKWFRRLAWRKVQRLIIGTPLARGRRTVTAALRHTEQGDTPGVQSLSSDAQPCSLVRSQGQPLFAGPAGADLRRRWGRRINKRGIWACLTPDEVGYVQTKAGAHWRHKESMAPILQDRLGLRDIDIFHSIYPGRRLLRKANCFRASTSCSASSR